MHQTLSRTFIWNSASVMLEGTAASTYIRRQAEMFVTFLQLCEAVGQKEEGREEREVRVLVWKHILKCSCTMPVYDKHLIFDVYFTNHFGFCSMSPAVPCSWLCVTFSYQIQLNLELNRQSVLPVYCSTFFPWLLFILDFWIPLPRLVHVQFHWASLPSLELSEVYMWSSGKPERTMTKVAKICPLVPVLPSHHSC